MIPAALPRALPETRAPVDETRRREVQGTHGVRAVRGPGHLRVAASALLACAAAAHAQTSAPSAPAVASIPYASVAEALRALEARDGSGTVVTHQEGWVVINEPQASAQWSFVPQGHAAWPAVVQRTIVRQPDGRAAVVTQRLCEAPAAACDALVAEFAKMDERIVQAVSARNRPRPPAPPQQ